eukprot:gene34019-43952_t
MNESSGSFQDFMQSIEENLHEMIKLSGNAPKDALQHWEAFSSAINWRETWIQVLLGSHCFLFILTILFRRNVDVQTIIFLAAVGLVAMAERINSFCAAHWKEFATQNYFDQYGVFVGIVFCAPLLLLLLFQLVNFLTLTSSALIKAKRLQLKQSMKEAAANNNSNTTTATTTKAKEE